MTGQKIEEDKLLTSHEAGDLLQMNPSSINKWVNEGLIQAFRTPGGHRRIRAADLVAFLDSHNIPVPRSLAPAGRRRLLIVDDDPKYVKALTRLLKPYGSRIDLAIATNGIDALVQVGSFRPHVMLLDIVIPEVDGLEVCRRLKANPDTTDVHVLIVSGQLTPSLEATAIGAGATRCLAKPIDIHLLARELGLEQEEIGTGR